MNSHTTRQFRECLDRMSSDIRQQAREAYARFMENPSHPGLRFKRVHDTEPVYSVRISRDVRALGVLKDDAIIWFWIGSHTEYERLLASL